MPAPAATLRVRATGDGRITLVDADGLSVLGRWAGRDRAEQPLKDGEDVPDNAYYRKAIEHGALELVESPKGAE